MDKNDILKNSGNKGNIIKLLKVIFRAYGISVLRAHGMGESGVQFPVGPYFEKLQNVSYTKQSTNFLRGEPRRKNFKVNNIYYP